ncbi:MAG: VCBS repeat-containing protein [Bacteroidetes bacterium]|nr:VCBS repeat-containing protein [Bacteroidota bacterium]
MNQKFLYNEMVRFYNRTRRKLKRITAKGKNLRKQDILKRRIARLFDLLTSMQHALKVGAAAVVLTAGTILFQPNDAQAQSFAAVQTNPFGLTNSDANNKPAFGDLDNDGDLDLMIGGSTGNFFYYQNTGTNATPLFAAPITNPFGLTDIGYYSVPSFADLDNDGDLDMMGMNSTFMYFQNIGSGIHPPDFAAAVINPFNLTYTQYYCLPTFVDLDNDGDLDIINSVADGDFLYFENTGTNTAPAFGAPLLNPFGLTNIGLPGSYIYFAAAAFADLDKDGDFDMISGTQQGNLMYYKNTGTPTSPAFAAMVANPFGLIPPVGNYPAFADLNNDGDSDLMLGTGGAFLDIVKMVRLYIKHHQH